MRASDFGLHTDTIGWYVPAIPDEKGVGYWGIHLYTTRWYCLVERVTHPQHNYN
jgi:hypothetical protein